MRGHWNGEQAISKYFSALPLLSLMGAETGVEPAMLQLMRLTRYRFSTLQYPDGKISTKPSGNGKTITTKTKEIAAVVGTCGLAPHQ